MPSRTTTRASTITPRQACATASRGAAGGSSAAASWSPTPVAFLIAALGVGALNNGAHTLSHPPLVFGGLFAWITLSWLYGYYTQDELRMAHSTADDVPGLVLLAAATTWAGQLADAALGVKAAADQQARRLLRRARVPRHRRCARSRAWSCAAG